jgi:hypothetical protein
MQATLARLAACGVTLCTMNELLAKLARVAKRRRRRRAAAALSHCHRRGE